MPSERVQRQIDLLLDQVEAARAGGDWGDLRAKSMEILDLEPDNEDALAFIAAWERREQRLATTSEDVPPLPLPRPEGASQPTSFASGRYEVERFLGEGGKKQVYLAKDTLLDRDVAFALIKTEGLDQVGRERIAREAQAMGRLGTHPHIVSVFDLGEEVGQPYIVTELMAGGDVEGLLERAEEHRLPLEEVLRLSGEVCQGLAFAHGQGIVHRDLKPGNVWLTAEGRAKIGDFGLAVATDRTRLTQAGVMVGTVSYMPPEQAMGGEIGPGSDLYSLGAMLYELCCGRPPFIGDESVAIIGQHLNTPPVAPSWHRSDCPPALEGLILRLLEKDPGRRPGSAEEVGNTLSSIGAGGPMLATATASTDAHAHQPQGHDPLYRRVFVGREAELMQLRQAFDAALSGQGSLAMVVGEPGIGKTALCEQLSTYGALRGARTLVGHSYEEGSLSLPYLPFVEAMRSYVLARETDGLRVDLGSGAADVARIVSEIADRIPLELRSAGDPQDERFRLLQAVSDFLRNASSVQPLLVVLEDLHWADRGTLDLLQHLARNLQGCRLLIVGTYRDVEVDRSHQLSASLAELRRSGSFLRLPLRGLTVDEVHRMYQELRGNEVPWSVAELVHRQTEGNPLFVQEVLRYLVEQGQVIREDGRYLLSEGPDAVLVVPEGLRDVIGKRLSRLSPQTNQLLSLASVIGREFELKTLARVNESSDDELLASIEEALAVAVLEEEHGPAGQVRYRFAHAFFREALYEELSAPRRLRLHRQVAEALEQVYARRLEEHASELAEHFSHSSDSTDLTKAVHYAELAATRAMAVYAFSEAARLLRQALEVQEVLDSGDTAKRFDLLIYLGRALQSVGENQRVLNQVAPEALALAEALDDPERASHACQLGIAAIHGLGAAAPWGTQEARYWTEQADRFAAEGSPARVWADYAATWVSLAREDPAVARAGATRAQEVASLLGDPVLQWVADVSWLYMTCLYPSTPGLAAKAIALAEALGSRSTDGVSSQVIGQACAFEAEVFLQAGLREQAESSVCRIEALAERTKKPEDELLAVGLSAWIPLAAGRLDEVLELDERLRIRGEETGLVEFAFFIREVIAINRARFYLGEIELAESADIYRIWSPEFAPSGFETVDALLEHVSDSPLGPDPAAGVLLPRCAMLAELAVLSGHKEIGRKLFGYLKSVPSVTFGNWIAAVVPVARLLGDLATLLGEREEARAFYEQSFEVCDRMGLRPEKALTSLGVAELLLAGDKDGQAEAQPHLDFAIAEFQAMKMRPSLERALGHRELLKA